MNKEFKPISAWGYIGYRILFAIPVLGLILAIVWAIGAENRNKKNLARSQIILFIIAIVLSVVLAVLAYLLGVDLSEYYTP